jgi:four helix bundle protein
MALRVIDDIVVVGREVNLLCKQAARHDRELASQIRRAWIRTGMNAGEAQHRRGAKGANRFDDAMGEAREAHTGLTMALAFDYVEKERATRVLDKVDRVVAILYKLANKPPQARG